MNALEDASLRAIFDDRPERLDEKSSMPASSACRFS